MAIRNAPPFVSFQKASTLPLEVNIKYPNLKRNQNIRKETSQPRFSLTSPVENHIIKLEDRFIAHRFSFHTYKIRYKRQNVGFRSIFRHWIIVVLLAVILVLLYFQLRIFDADYHFQNKKEIIHLELIEKGFNIDYYKAEKPENEYCEVIHIGIVCSGYTSNVFFHSLVKSILMHRTNPLHIHILVDDDSKQVLSTLFKTWQIPQVTVTYYDLNKWLKDVRWIPNTHYSGNYGLLKLIFPKIISANVTNKILILDTDLTVVGDIYELWKIFSKFGDKQAMGMVENQSEYYLGKLFRSHPWPALDKGYNSGVLLYHLLQLKALNFDQLWVNVTKRLTPTYGSVSLGDQDILNALIVENPEIVYNLPCFWNTQMSDASLSASCYKHHKPMIIHWNSPKKFKVQHKSGQLFRSLAEAVSELNGNTLRKFPLFCDEENNIHYSDISEEDCAKFYYPPNKYYRTLLYFREFKFIAEENDITFVTQLSFDRFQSMEDFASVWTGPISFTLYVTDQELTKCIQLISESKTLQDRTNISYHAVFKDGDFYPINILRNVGLKNVKTPYVFMADVDFVPVRNLYNILKDNIKSMGELTKKALVVPAFEMTSRIAQIPTSKLDLINALDKKQAIPFLSDVWSPGHASTDYQKWREELEPYKVQWNMDYEPYVVVSSNVVPYDERFFGFGWNKVSHVMELEAQGYEFIVLSDVFIIHKPHRFSYDNIRYRKWPNYRLCQKFLKKTFVEELNAKYNKQFLKLIPNLDMPEYDSIRKKRNVESSTEVHDSTDHFLVWGGKEKAIAKTEYRKKSNKFPRKQFSKEEASEEADYLFYEDTHPYPSTLYSPKENKTAYEYMIRKMEKKLHYLETNKETMNYDYNSEEIELSPVDSSTIANNEGSTFIADEHLRQIDKEYLDEPHDSIGEKFKNNEVNRNKTNA